MAISISNLTSGIAATNGSSQATSSISPTSNNLILAVVHSRTSITAEPNQPTISGCGLTWVAIASVYYDTTSSSRKKLTVFRALGTASSGALTADFGGQTQTHVSWAVDEVSGMDTTGTNGSGAIVQYATNQDETISSATITATLSAFSSSTNAAYGAFGQDNFIQTGPTVGSGFTSLASTAVDSISTQTEYKASEDTTVDYSYTTNCIMGVIALEIKEASGSTSHDVNITESATATEASGNTIVTSASVTESATATESSATDGQISASITESASASESSSNTLVANATITESGTASESSSSSIVTPLSVDHMLSGAITETTARIIARLSGETVDATLEYATNSGFTSSFETSAVNVTSGNDLIADFNLTGLTANTQYYYRVVINGTPDSLEGKFKTNTVGQYSFNFAFSGDAEIVDTNDVYNRITARTPLFFFALGDTPYTDYNNTFYGPYQDAYKAWFGAAYVKNMLANIPYQYVWDDHDFCGNDSDSSAQGKPYVQSVYRQHIPHYPLEVSDSIYHAFTVGRVRFIVTDLRSERSGSTYIGTSQMTWFKAEISAVASDPDLELIVWASSSPYIASAGSDTWFGASAQRVEIADHIASVNMQNNFCIISADAHMIAADDGTNSDYSTSVVGGFPVFHSAPLNRSNSTKGGPYSEGTFSSTVGQYSIMSITDNGTNIDVNVKGYDNTDTQLYSLSFSTPAALTSSITETATASESSSNTLTTSAVITESAAATDSLVSQVVFNAVIEEINNAGESSNRQLNISAVISETGNAVELISADIINLVFQEESASATETSSNYSNSNALVIESANATETALAQAILNALINESGEAIDVSNGQLFITLNVRKSILTLNKEHRIYTLPADSGIYKDDNYVSID